MNVCLISRVVYGHGVKGGMELHGKILGEALVRRGHDVAAIASRHPDGILSETASGMAVRYLPDTQFGSRRKGWPEKSVMAYSRLNETKPFDLIWSQSFDAFGFARRPRGARPPIVATIHGCVAQETRSFLSNARRYRKTPSRLAAGVAGLFYAYFVCQRPLLETADRIVCVSRSVSDDLAKWFGRRFAEKCSVVENGIDANRFRPDAAARARWREICGTLPHETLLLSAGRLTHAKGHHLAIEALRSLVEGNVPARLAVAGDGPHRRALEDLTRSLGLGDRVRFAGFVERDEIAGYYNAADVFLMPTMTVEGLPFVLLEAMACGVPVVASDIGGNREVLAGGAAGLLVEPGNADRLAESVEKLVEFPELGRRLSEVGRRTVARRHCHDTMARRTLAIMEAAAGERRRP